jgi:hypothetical protein
VDTIYSPLFLALLTKYKATTTFITKSMIQLLCFLLLPYIMAQFNIPHLPKVLTQGILSQVLALGHYHYHYQSHYHCHCHCHCRCLCLCL